MRSPLRRRSCGSLVAALCFHLMGSTAAASWVPDGIAVSRTGLIQTAPAIVADGAGGAYFVWEDGRSAPFRSFAQHLSAAGEVVAGWSAAGVALPTDGVERHRPFAIADGEGGLLVVDDGGPVNRSPLIVSHVTGGGTMAGDWPASGATISGYPDGPGPSGTACCRNWAPVIARVGSGAVFTTWMYTNRFWEPARVGAFDQTGAAAPGWAVNGIWVENELYYHHGPVVAAGSHADAFIAMPGTGEFVRRALPGGGVSATAYEPAGGGTRSAPGIVEDGAGGVLVFWNDLAFTPPRLKAQHLLSDLSVAPGWPAAGLDVCTLANEAGTQVEMPEFRETFPRSSVAPDGQGGAFVVWSDLRADSSDADIYAQHVLADGSLASGWPENGLALCTAAGDQRRPRVVADGAGGIIVVWQDKRSGVGHDVYALRVNAAGHAMHGWPVDGLPVCTVSGDQTTPVVAADASGNALIAWADARAGASQIYAQRIAADPVLDASPAGARDAGFAIQQIHPNPARGAGFSVTFHLPSAGAAVLELIDIGGRLVASRRVVGASAGAQTERFDDDATPASGIYWIRLTQAGRTLAEPICVMR